MNFSGAILNKISVHFVGNKHLEEDLTLSENELELDDETSEKLTQTILPRFEKVFDEFKFFNVTSLEYNEVYNLVNQIFEDNGSFHLLTIQLAQHLYEQSEHPKINGGEFYVCHFDNILFDNRNVDVVGIFKTESKANFFKVNKQNKQFDIEQVEGIDFNKFEKGCLIFNTKKEDGYIVSVIDNQKSGGEARYWKDEFLSLEIISNEYSQTNDIMGMTKNYIANQLPEDFEVTKADQVDLLNKSVDFFKNNDEFNTNQFAEEIFEDENVIESFNRFNTHFKEENEIQYEDNFEISQQAVKKQSRSFKSVIKLDKNFHIYVHGNKNLIEQGVDEFGKKYYKIFYDEEH